MVGTLLLGGWLKALSAVASALFATVILTGNPRRPANQFLAAFLALIAANQGAEALRLLGRGVVDATLLSQLALVFAALDPFFLYYFVSIYPRRNALNAPWKVALVLAASACFAASAILWPSDAPRGAPAVVFAWAVFTALAYTAALVVAARGLTERDHNPAVRLLVPALCVAALPAWPRVLDATLYVMYLGRLPSVFSFVGRITLLAVAVGAVAWSLRGRQLTSDGRRALRQGVALALGLSAAFYASQAYYVLSWGQPHPRLHAALYAVYPSAAALRWLLFGALVSMAVLRHQMLGLSLRARLRAARVLVALAIVGATALLLAVAHGNLSNGSLPLTAVDLAIVGVVVAASQGFRSMVGHVASKVYGVPAPGDLASSLTAYRRAVEQAIREGRALSADPGLERLRRELHLDPETARVVEEMVTTTASERPTPGALVAGRYRVERVLGRGGSGRAYLAEDTLLERSVVLKEVPHNGDADGAALREARVAGGLNHPNVITVYNVVEVPGASLIVSEHAPGGSLSERLTHGEPLRPREALAILDDVLAALEAVHAHGVVHRDLKPGNILLTGDGVAKVADFGVARVRQGVTMRLNAPGGVIGTPAYMAPEQRRGQVATPATDVYAAGLLMRRLLDPPLHEALEAVARRALHHDPARRWESAAAMRRALQRAADAASLDAREP